MRTPDQIPDRGIQGFAPDSLPVARTSSVVCIANLSSQEAGTPADMTC